VDAQLLAAGADATTYYDLTVANSYVLPHSGRGLI
jgi:hypothetical protein